MRNGDSAACRLCDGLMLVVVAVGDTTEPLAIRLHDGAGGQALETRWLRGRDEPGSRIWLATVRWPASAPIDDSTHLVVGSSDERAPLLVRPRLQAPDELARSVSSQDSDMRERLLRFLGRAGVEHAMPEDEAPGEALLVIRDALREPLPMADIRPDEVAGLRLDRVCRIDARAFWLEGWFRDAGFGMQSLVAVSPEGARAQLEGHVWLHARPDVDEAYRLKATTEGPTPNRGFCAYCELEWPSGHPTGWLVQMTDAAGSGIEATSRQFVDGVGELRGTLLKPLRQGMPDDETFTGVLQPALSRLQRRVAEEVEGEELLDVGEPPTTPDVSIIVALDRRLDLIQHQMAQFALDAALRSAELIYVVSPEAAADLIRMGRDLHELYEVPFRVLTLSRRAGTIDATNAGARIARGRLLLLLGRSVIPDRPGWLAPMIARHDETASIGAVGAKLLHEDGSIQHAGLMLKQRDRAEAWEAVSAYAGLNRRLGRANQALPVTAVARACLLIATDRYWEHGGLAGRYIDGAFEDADLCLRLREAACENWYVPEAELVHLERYGEQAAPPAAGRYNAWLFEEVWGDRLRAGGGERQGQPRAVRLAPRYPRHGSGRPGVPVEILETTDPEDDGDAAGGELERPRPGEELQPYAKTYSFAVEGWVARSTAAPIEVELSAEGRMLRRTPANLPRPESIGGDNESGALGFRAVVGTLSLPREFEVEIDAVQPDGSRKPLGTVRGRRRILRSGFEPQLQPALITTLGRTGSSWLALLLSCHPEVLAYQPFVYEARVTSYWMTALQALAEPASYMQLIRPELYPGHWWLGDDLPIPLPARLRDPHMAQWLGRDGVEMLAGFCQSRIEDFYQEVARSESKARARFFTEKAWPDRHVPRIVSELYPEGRELILMRDLRDIVCSIFGFNAKRGVTSFGREAADSDEEFVRGLREGGVRMLESWHDRPETAHLVRYEDLILSPEPTLAAVFAHLGVDASPGSVTTVLDTAAKTLPEAQSGHRTSRSVSSSIGRWRQELSTELVAVCHEAFGDVLEAFGYDDVDVVSSSAATSGSL